MKASTREWVAKAEEDFAVALTLARPRKKPLSAPICFHACPGSERVRGRAGSKILERSGAGRTVLR
jgi:hypothetical protein